MTYYDILGIPKTATDAEITRAYQAQLGFFRSSSFDGSPEVAEAKAAQLTEAYQTLHPPQRRRAYDQSITGRTRREGKPPPDPTNRTYSASQREAQLLDYMHFLHWKLSELPHAARAPFRIEGPAIDGLYDLPTGQRSAEALAYRMILYMGLPPVQPKVHLHTSAAPPEDRAGDFSGKQFACTINIYKRPYYRAKQIEAIMAHECTHYFLAYHHISFPNRDNNELLTDVAAVYLGFGHLLLEGYERIYHTQQQYSTIGYITTDEIRILQKRRELLASGASWKRPRFHRPKVWRTVAVWAVILAGLACWGGFLAPKSSERVARPSTTPPVLLSPDEMQNVTGGLKTSLDESPQPTTRPFSGRIFLGVDADRKAPLTVETDGSNDYYIRLRDAATGEAVMDFYVQGDQGAKVNVPLGNYELSYATGPAWYGPALLFGEDTAYYRIDTPFLFEADDSKVYGWTLTLHSVTDGTLSSETISDSDF